MFLPLSDAPNPQRTPWVTYGLILANVAVYVLFNLPLGISAVSPADPRLPEYLNAIRSALPPDVSLREVLGQVSQYDLFVFEHGFRPSAPEAVDLFTSMFLHGGFLHLFGNMLFLWIYGDNVEYRLGRTMYLLAYVATGVAATVFYTVIAPSSTLPLLGASGAISGVLGFYFLWFPRNVVRMFVFLFPFVMNVFTIPARIVLGMYLIVDNLIPLVFTYGQAGGGVAHGAHIGGFLAGLAAAWLMDRRAAEAVPSEYRATAVAAAPASEVQAAIDRGDMASAARAYFSNGSSRLSPDSMLRLADWLAAHGHTEAATVVYQRFLRDHPAAPGTAEAHLGIGLMALRMGQVASAYQYLQRALELGPSPETRARAVDALRVIANQQKYPMRRYPQVH